MAIEVLSPQNDADNWMYRQPQVNLACSASMRMWLVSLCAGLGVFQSALSDSFASLEVAMGAVAAAVITERVANHTLKTGASLKDGSAVASALIFTLLLPSHLSPVLAALGMVFAMAVIKHSFGGLGANWFNPALGGWLFVRVSWPEAFSQALTGPFEDTLPAFFSGLTGPVHAFLDRRFFPLFGAELPGDYMEFFFYSGAGIIADRGLLGLLLGTIIISAFQVGRFWVPAVFLGLYAVLVRLSGALPLGGFWGAGDVLSGLCSGGTITAAFLLSMDPATGAKSTAGAALGAVLSAFFAVLFRYSGMEPLGAVFAVILVNTLYPLIRMGESRWFYVSGGKLPPPWTGRFHSGRQG
jgi:electron transport complex protein RnfD